MTDTPPLDAPATPAAPPAPPPSTVKPVNCPNCGGTVDIRVAGTTVSVICSHCGSTLDATSPDLQVIAKADQALKTPEIPLGTRGVLKGKTWEVVGYQERTDEEVTWAEYLLFNPYEGYAFLVDDGRRFNLGFLLDKLPTSHWGLGLSVDGLNVSRFGDPYPVHTIFVVGEFYWRVQVGETVEETDYVTPGTMLACEDYQGERTWTRLDMLDWGEAEAAFGIAPRRKEYSHPAPHERSPFKAQLFEAWVIGLIAAVTLFVISGMAGSQQRIATSSIDAVLDGPEKTLVIKDVVLPPGRNRVEIDAEASSLDNSWVDLDYSLTDQKTQDSIDSYGTAEYYSGSDSDGPWTEGDRRPTTDFSSIPGGKYDVVVTVSAHKWNGAGASSSTPVTDTSLMGGHGFADGGWGSSSTGGVTVPVTVTVDRGGLFGGNVVLGLLLILIWPIIVLFRHLGFEKRRKAVLSSGSDDDDDDD
ncbi:DUF4178 domain-containing protein [Sphingomonas panacisoli]|uniref:DUF4178 domain-containing protein n=1 Tax=Sphingomonas panacisoli TaxID=1813879 RepID=A0A5B8LJ83_9SPHN|nr:DUF4178 domain-containing protein [Sphingomonas panacisoli]QDZ08278.1 DUF4178 domain-containing protein [Sphingomonas panacisoli]